MRKSIMALAILTLSTPPLFAAPTDYFSLHQLPYSQYQNKQGQFVSLTGGYKALFNHKDPFVGCNLGFAVNDSCANTTLATSDISYVYTQVDATKPALNLGGKFKVWLPAGLKRLDVTGYFPQQVYANVRVRFREPPVSDATSNFTTEQALPENSLSRLVNGEEFTIGGTTNGSIEISSKAGPLATPLVKGGWLYFSQAGTTRISFLTIGLIADPTKFKADYDSLIFGSDGDPSESCTSNCTTPSPTDTAPSNLNLQSFPQKAGALAGSTVQSNPLVLTGTGTWSISVGNGQFSINDGPFQSVSSTAKPGDKIIVQVTASSVSEGTSVASLTIGTTSTTFSVVTGKTNSSVKLERQGGGSSPLLYTGRSSQILPIGIFISEASGNSIKASGTGIQFSLGQGARFQAGTSFSLTGATDGEIPPLDTDLLSIGTTSRDKLTVGFKSLTDNNSNMGKLLVGTKAGAQITLDLAGSLVAGTTVPLSLTGDATADLFDFVTLRDATQYKAIDPAKLASLRPAGDAVELPSIQITEADKGALTSGGIAIVLPEKFLLDKAATPTVVVSRPDGTVVTASPSVAFGDAAKDVRLTIDTASANWKSASEGPYHIEIRGLKAKALDGAPSELSLVIGGTQDPKKTTLSDSDIGWDVGAKATRSTIKVGVTSRSANYPVVSLADATKVALKGLNLSVAAADEDKSGSLYVAAVVGGTLYFKTSLNDWTPYFQVLKDASAAKSGSLSLKSLDLKTSTPKNAFVFDLFTTETSNLSELTKIIGPFSIIVGYGTGSSGDDPNPFGTNQENAFANMLRSGNYKTLLTMPQ